MGSLAAAKYYETLREPCMVKGQKVPDLQGMPSGTFQMVSSGILGTNSAGAAAIIVAPRTGANAIGVAVVTPATTIVASWTVSSMTGQTPVALNFGKVRPVSACLDVEFIGNTSTDSGYLISSCSPSGTQNATPIDLSTWETSLSNTLTTPLRGGVRVLWRPEDNSDFEYTISTATDLNAAAAAAYANSSPYIAVAIAGAAASTNVARWMLFVNFEGLPAAQQLNLLSTEGSPVDVEGTARVLQAVSKLPTATPLGPTGGGIGETALRQIFADAPSYLAMGSQIYRGVSHAFGSTSKSAFDFS